MVAERQCPEDMIDNKYLGTYMTWKDIVQKYPNRWVYLTDYELDKNDRIIGGILTVVCREPEIRLITDIITGSNKGGIFDRTTELPGNILWVE